MYCLVCMSSTLAIPAPHIITGTFFFLANSTQCSECQGHSDKIVPPPHIIRLILFKNFKLGKYEFLNDCNNFLRGDAVNPHLRLLYIVSVTIRSTLGYFFSIHSESAVITDILAISLNCNIILSNIASSPIL